jgi:hypothetical protein
MKKSDYLFQVRNGTSYKILRLTVLAGVASLALTLLTTIALLAKFTEVEILHATIGAFILAGPAILWLSLVWLVTDVADCAIMIAWQGQQGGRVGSPSKARAKPETTSEPRRRLKRTPRAPAPSWTVTCPSCFAQASTPSDPAGQICECPDCGSEFDADGCTIEDHE